ncbi:Peptidase aspartic [Cordyceps fumosorosea ARSEF 2679]|uniref:Peptidase aspartic n=1 Tax=Cordyceps fumosorosea (strain ARSEF 2679) TaxID=1081104 RepID=A0A167Y9S4_CORFA|nr:Peptidase aspartic [Cordyceps fumosorosea ARSEF 2679]OAA66033.1 Peptidase aspartic [Cordyceps fumosorosea ARSEF 2679]
MAAGSLLPTAHGNNCATSPVRLSIENVTISSGKIRRGVAMQVGTPPQKLAFQPKWDNNNTYVFGPECLYEDFIHTPDACATFRGGLFDPDKSKSGGSTNRSFVPPKDPFASDSYAYFTDILELDSNVSLEDFPIGRATNSSDWGLQAYDPLNIIGMSSGSLFLGTLYQTGKIASRSFGYFWGLDGTSSRDQLDGSFVVGGYDKAKTIGTPYTGAISVKGNCPTGMIVTIRDIVLNFRNGTDKSIFPSDNGGTALLACVYPELPSLMDMPRTPYFSNLLAATGLLEGKRSTGIHWWNVLVSAKSNQLYDGDMTVHLEGGLQIAIPNRLLIVPETKIADSGDVVSNSSSQVILIDSLQDVTAKMVVDEKNALLQGGRACPTGSATSPSSQPSSQPQQDGHDRKGLSTAAIAGIAVGAVAVVALLGGLVWFLLRRQKTRAAAEAEAAEAKSHTARDLLKEGKPATGEDYYPSQGIPQYIPHNIPQELPVETRGHTPVELAG